MMYKLMMVLLSCYSSGVSCEELNIHEKMYYDLDPNSFASCVRRFNGTHQFGCSSDIDGNVGVLHIVTSMKDIEWLAHNSSRGPYVALLDLSMFTSNYLVPLNSSSNVNGIIIKNRNESPNKKPAFFSQEDTCPNRYTSINPSTKEPSCDSKTPWNPYGTNIMNENWKFPIVIISDETILESLEKCYTDNNTPLTVQEDTWHPLCGVEMQMGMSGTTNTEVCMRRNRLYYENHPVQQCDVLGGRNIVYSVDKLSADKPPKNNSLIIVTARLDSKSMFDGMVPGAMSTATSIVTLLATARILSQAKAKLNTSPTRNVLFLLLDGEAYDFIGSSRVIYDMKRGAFPKSKLSIAPQHVDLMVELSQIAQSKNLSIHFTSPGPTVEDFARIVKNSANATNLMVEEMTEFNPLTPSSLLYFQNHFPNLSGVLLTSKNESVNPNKYYHSIFDDESNVDYHYYNGTSVPTDSIQHSIKSIATTLGQALLKKMYGEEVSTTETVDDKLVDEMLHFYLKSHNSSLINNITGYVDTSRPTFFVGVVGQKRYTVTGTAVLLANFTGTVTNLTMDECKAKSIQIHDQGTLDNENYIWIYAKNNGETTGYCNKNLVNFMAAVSPAFVIDDYSDWRSSLYPSWSESSWMRLGLRMFLQPSPNYEKLVFTCGVCVLSISFLVVFSLKKHISRLVKNIEAESVLHNASVVGTS